MGIFSIKIKIGSLEGRQRSTLDMIVDTGAYLSVVPQDTLKPLGVEPRWKRRFTLANGQKIIREVGVALFQFNGNEGASEVVFGLKTDKPLLGALTLEALSLKVNPKKKKLEPDELLLL